MLAYEFETKLKDEHLILPNNILQKIGKNVIVRIIIFKKEKNNQQLDSQKNAKQKMLKMKGKVRWEGSLEDMRKDRTWSL